MYGIAVADSDDKNLALMETVVEGVEACKRRNDVVRGMYSVPEGATPEMVKEGIREVYKDILDFPFSPGESEI